MLTSLASRTPEDDAESGSSGASEPLLGGASSGEDGSSGADDENGEESKGKVGLMLWALLGGSTHPSSSCPLTYRHRSYLHPNVAVVIVSNELDLTAWLSYSVTSFFLTAFYLLPFGSLWPLPCCRRRLPQRARS